MYATEPKNVKQATLQLNWNPDVQKSLAQHSVFQREPRKEDASSASIMPTVNRLCSPHLTYLLTDFFFVRIWKATVNSSRHLSVCARDTAIDDG